MDSWGPSLQDPVALTPSAKAAACAPAGSSPPVLSTLAAPMLGLSLGEDPAYLAALEQAVRSSAAGSLPGAAVRPPARMPASATTPPPAPPAAIRRTMPPPPPPPRGPGPQGPSCVQGEVEWKSGTALSEKPKEGKPDKGGLKAAAAAAAAAAAEAEAAAAAAEASAEASAASGSVPWSLVGNHWSPAQMQRALKTGAAFRGKFRINANDRREGYVTVEGLPADLLLRGEASHGRAFDGDEVAVQVQGVDKWYTVHKLLQGNNSNNKAAELNGGPPAWHVSSSPEEAKGFIKGVLTDHPAMRATAKVVGILNPGPKRECLVGVLQAAQSNAVQSGEKVLYLLPLDPHMPRCQVTPTSVKGLPAELLAEAEATDVATRTLMSARITDWPPASKHPFAELRASLGQAGEIESETAAILAMEGVRAEAFTEEVVACLPKKWSIREEDLKERRDFRGTRIFSIDPPTAKDLDDALSIEPLDQLSDGSGPGYRVGVHIADVATFIPPYSALDVEAGRRSTSVYMVQRVIPMLPSLLCEELCSLNPGVDRFAFSVVWDMDASGRVVSQWAGRSVICSCVKLSYPMVQEMIEGRFIAEECPARIHGAHSWEQVIADSLALNSIARKLRNARFDNGALRLDNARLFFGLDKDGNPCSVGQYIQREANQLVEEYMLLANMTVATLISDAFPEQALLRRHTVPNQRKLDYLAQVSDEYGLGINTANSATMQASLAALRATSDDPAMVEVITLLATKPMQLAQYFSTGNAEDREGWRHYALAVDAYTHFTSPIRRYPDVVVHRLLAAALDMQTSGISKEAAVKKHQLFGQELCGKVGEHCNELRLRARNAQDASLKMYLCVFLRRSPGIAEAVVVQAGGDKYWSVYIPQYAIECQMFVDGMGVPLRAVWEQGSKTLVLEEGSPVSTDQGANNGQHGKGRGGIGAGSGGGPTDPDSASFEYTAWMSELCSKLPLRNENHVMPARLPLQIKMFARIPVVLVSPLRPGHISEVCAKIYWHTDTPAPSPIAEISGREAEGAFCIPCDAMQD